MKKIIVVSAIVIIALGGIILYQNQNKNKSEELNKASVALSWIPSASFTGDIVGLTKFDEQNGLDLNAEFGGPGINTAQQVQSGQHTFGYLAADEVLAANDKGADFVILGVVSYYSPAGFVSLAEKNIKTPKDLEGKKVGILPFGNATMIYESMLKKNNVNRKTINESTVSADMKPFLSGSYDVHPVFVYDETVDLDKQGIAYNVIKPQDFGVSIKGPVYFTKRETLEQHPEMVKAFVTTMAEGWNYAIKNPDESISLLKAYAPEIDESRERKVLEKGIPYFTGYKNQPLNSDTESWNDMVEEMKDAGAIKNNVDLGRVLQFQFIHQYYQK